MHTHAHVRAHTHTHKCTKNDVIGQTEGRGKKSAETASAWVLSSEKTPPCLPCNWTVPALWTLEPLDYVKGV